MTHLTPNPNHMSDNTASNHPNSPTHIPNVDTIIYRLGAMEVQLSSLAEKLDEVCKGFLSEKKCSAPNACVGLGVRLSNIEDCVKDLYIRVGALERANEYNRGFGRGMIFAVGAFGGIIGAFGGLLLRKVFGGP